MLLENALWRSNRPPIVIDDLRPGHWPEVARIYAEGIATGAATFETEEKANRDGDIGGEADGARHKASGGFRSCRERQMPVLVRVAVDGQLPDVAAVGFERQRPEVHGERDAERRSGLDPRRTTNLQRANSTRIGSSLSGTVTG